MTMNIIQQQAIKTAEVNSTMQCMAGGDIRKGELVGIARSESAEGWYSSYGVCDGVGEY